jgi:hypothetical protein
MPGLFFYAYMGTLGQLAVRIMRGKSYPRTLEYWIWGGAFITTVLLLVVLGRVARRAIQTPLERGSSSTPKGRFERGVLYR